MKRCPAVLLTLLCCSPAAPLAAQDDADGEIVDVVSLPAHDAFDRFEWYGEELEYAIEILGSEAARSAVQVGYPQTDENGHTYTPVYGLAISIGFFGSVYPLEDSAETHLDTATGLPIWTSKTIDERDVLRIYEVDYEREGFRSRVNRTRDGIEAEYFRYTPTDLHDALSWIYDLRSRDLSVGAEYTYHIYDGWKLSRLTVRVEQHTEVYTELGFLPVAEMRFVREVLSSAAPLPWANQAVSLPPIYFVSGEADEIGVGWFGLDERRLPVGTQIDTPIGNMRLLLTEVRGPDASYTADPSMGAFDRWPSLAPDTVSTSESQTEPVEPEAPESNGPSDL
jgi:hypothetical protein